MLRRVLPAVTLWMIALAVIGAQEVGAQEVNALEEPVSAQIIRMLEAELSEEIVLAWLDGWLDEEPLATEPLSADELVALKNAGASDDLLKTLIARTRSVREAGDATLSAAPPSVAAPEIGPVPPGDGSRSLVTFKVSYLARFEEPDPEWDLFVYIDGIPLTYVTTGSLGTRAAEIEFQRSLSAGAHLLRVTQERHFRRRGSWRHETRVAATEFPFELTGGAPVRLELGFTERLMDYQDPLVFALTQGDEVTDTGRVGADAETWPYLCDDVEASMAGGKPSREQRRRLESCVRWDSLWRTVATPSRSEVLAAMAEFDFRPQPKGV